MFLGFGINQIARASILRTGYAVNFHTGIAFERSVQVPCEFTGRTFHGHLSIRKNRCLFFPVLTRNRRDLLPEAVFSSACAPKAIDLDDAGHSFRLLARSERCFLEHRILHPPCARGPVPDRIVNDICRSHGPNSRIPEPRRHRYEARCEPNRKWWMPEFQRNSQIRLLQATCCDRKVCQPCRPPRAL